MGIVLYGVAVAGGVAATTVGADAAGFLDPLAFNLGFAGAVSLAWRFPRADGVERQQVQWFAAAVGLALRLGVYLALTTTSTRLLPNGSPLAVAASPLAVAALFQTLVDRRFNCARYDADQALVAFSAQMREDVDLDTVCPDLVDVVQDTLHRASVGLWLRNPARATP